MNTFADFGLIPSLLKTLKEKRLSKPTEIQANVIPLIMGGQSVVGVSETGSGKTLAYALPLLNHLKSLEDVGDAVKVENSPRAIVMVPTRELGEQVSKVFKTLTHDTRLRVRPALGGMTLAQAKKNTSGAFEVLLATPGRLVQMIEGGMINLSDVRFLVFDEADQMMDQGFLPDSNFVVESCPEDLQMALFSATVSTTVQQLINGLFANAEVVRSKNSGKVVSSLTTKNMIVENGERWPLFEKILSQRTEGGTMVFTNTREQCDKLAQLLVDKGYACAVYRGEMDHSERRANLKKFREGKVDLLVATDLAGRGLDLEHVGRVINYHLPKEMANYIHRAGRTARAGRKGLVINLVTERDRNLISKLEGNKPPSLEKKTTTPDGKQRVASTKRFKHLRGKPKVKAK
ncbi:DEAD/DEAH box helicase [Bdellovibrio sp. HCB337]|uniref:DEAD/DEAH box helicase n=1 Tax=Bdellovibrio sp. HCB337 TaxID=3394358 RepID=UPI0039A6D4DD